MLKIGTHGSKLALWQAEFTQAELARIGVESELVVIKTQDDLVQHLGFDKLEDKGFFPKAIEEALLRGEVDLAVHSMEDLPTSQPEGLCITAVSYRHNPSDLLIIRKESYVENVLLKLAPNAIVGSSANRRKAQILAYRPDLQLKDIQGNVPARLEKLRTGDFDAIFLTAAGVERLGLDTPDFEVLELPAREFVPAPAQGVLAWQTNRDDTATRLILKQLHHPEVSSCTNVERRVLQLMENLPLGVFCERDGAGNYHAFAACEIEGQLRRTRLSSSTSFGMAEKLVEGLII